MPTTFRPYQLLPGWPIHIEVTLTDGTRADLVGVVDRVTDLAGNTVQRMTVTQATLTPVDD